MTAPDPIRARLDEDKVRQLLDAIVEHFTPQEFVRWLATQGDYCCAIGCGSGACESCPCCGAGWCISGRDGLPENPDDLALWLEVAAEHNPVADALAAALSTPARTTRDQEKR